MSPSKIAIALTLIAGLHTVAMAQTPSEDQEILRSMFVFNSKMASQGNPQAQFKIAEMYEFGRGTDLNLDKSLLWYQKSAKGGNAQAIAKLESVQAKIAQRDAPQQAKSAPVKKSRARPQRPAPQTRAKRPQPPTRPMPAKPPTRKVQAPTAAKPRCELGMSSMLGRDGVLAPDRPDRSRHTPCAVRSHVGYALA